MVKKAKNIYISAMKNKMINVGTHASGPSATGGFEVKAIWEVYSEPGYNVRRSGASPGHLLAIRTLGGEGTLMLAGLGKVLLLPNTLILVEQNKLKHYYCSGENWDFWWFEFSMQGALPFPLHRLPPSARGQLEVDRQIK